MSSMVSKSHIKLQDLAPFLRGYDSKSPETAQDWAKGQSSGFAPGMLIFCLEKVAAAPGLAVGRRDEAGDSYRVRDLCIVVGEDGGRPLVVNITASAYELRFLEVLMYEKAKKAILDEKDFSFTAVRPVQKLEKSKIEEIEQMGAVYAQGGSRRSLVVDATAPQEPAMALLSSLGVKLTMVGIGKQALDIGYICLLLFGPEGRTEDKNRAQVRSAFMPIPLSEPLGTKVASSQPPQAATVWQGPLPAGEVQVPPGSESLLMGVQQTVNVEKEEGSWGSTDFGDTWATPPEKAPDNRGATGEPGAPQYSFTPPAGSQPSASWQPPATSIPEFAFAPQPASSFPSPPMDFQEELSHQTEFEQHLGASKSPDPKSTWDDTSAPGVSEWGDSAATINSAAPSTGNPPSTWTPPASNAPTVSDWGAPPAPLSTPAPDWASSSGGDWGAPPAAVPEVTDWTPATAPSSGDWGAPPAPLPQGGNTGDWGSGAVQPAASSFAQPESVNIAAQSQSGSWQQSASPVGTTPGTGSWNTPWAQGPGGDPESPSASTLPPLTDAESQLNEGEAGSPIPKKDANLFNRLYQQLAKGSPGASATNLPPMHPESSLQAEANTSPNASQTNLPRLSQELLSRTTAPQSPNASSTNLQPMDPELAAHFRIPSPPPGEMPDTNTVNSTSSQTNEPVAAPSFDWGAPVAEPSVPNTVNTEGGETGNEAPSWLESLDKKKATPFSSATNLKAPTGNPSQRKAPITGVRQNVEFEMDLPADLELLRETGKIKMTPSMKDAVKRKSVEAAAKLSAQSGKSTNEVQDYSAVQNTGTQSSSKIAAVPTGQPSQPGAPVSPVSPGAQSFPVKPADENLAADVTAPTVPESAGEIKPKLSTEEDPYKHLAEALSGLMSIDDEPAEDSRESSVESSGTKTPELNAAASGAPGSVVNKPFELKDLHEPVTAATTSEGLSRSFDPLGSSSPSLLGGTEETSASSPAEAVSFDERDTTSTEAAVDAAAKTPASKSRFAAMEAAFSTHNAPPIKPLSIDSQPSINTGSFEIVPTSEESKSIDEGEPIETIAAQDVAPKTETNEEPTNEANQPELLLAADTDFLITTRTDVPVLDDMHESPSPLDALDPSVLITSASDIPSLPAAAAALRAASSAVPSDNADGGANSAGKIDGAQSKPAVAKPASFQEPRLVMNEMVTLMNKLEQQVSKAAKKISSRSEEIKQRLNKQVDDLISAASQVENQNQIVVQDTTAKLSKSLDSSTDDARQNISDIAAGGRYSIKQMLSTNQQSVDDTKAKLLEDLTKACDEFRKESESLTQECETFLNKFVKDKTDLIDATLNEITGRLDETNGSFLAKITARFDRFKERMNDEASSIGRSLERNVHSMFEEIDGSWDRASEKLKLTKSEFEQTILHSVKTVELSASQNTRQILISSMAPQLRERTRRLLDLKDSQTKQFMSDTVAQSSLQLQGLESSLAAARQQLHTLVDDCVSNLDGVGRGQQAGLEEIFKTASGKTEKLTTEVQLAIQDAQSRVHETEIVCKKLAENSSVDTDTELTDERAATTQGIQKLKSQCNSQIQNSLEDACMRLEQLSQKVQNEATSHRMHQTQNARESSEAGLNRIREAMQEAFSAIQTAREQNME